MKKYITNYILFIMILIILPVIVGMVIRGGDAKAEPEYMPGISLSVSDTAYTPDTPTEAARLSSSFPITESLPESIPVLVDGGVVLYDLEQYCIAALAAEMPALFNQETLKAGAVAIRTYAYYKYLHPNNDHPGAVVCDNPAHCNAMLPESKAAQIMGEYWINNYYGLIKQAVAETEGEIIVYDGEPILAVYHAAAGGGRTENSGDAWNEQLPYLVSVESQWEDNTDGYYGRVEVNRREFEDRMQRLGVNADGGGYAVRLTYTQGGDVKHVEINGVEINGQRMRDMFTLPSGCYEIQFAEERVVFLTQGSGHGVGLSQHGANEMAKRGADYRGIIQHYYTGAAVNQTADTFAAAYLSNGGAKDE